MTSPVKEIQNKILEITVHNVGGQFKFVMPDKDVLILNAEEAARVFRVGAMAIRFADEHKMLVEELGEWFEDHLTRFSVAYLTYRDSGFVFLLIQRDRVYCSESEDELSALELKLAKDYSVIKTSVMALPQCSKESRQSFLSESGIVFKVNDGN